LAEDILRIELLNEIAIRSRVTALSILNLKLLQAFAY
jgi:hypothetical protein